MNVYITFQVLVVIVLLGPSSLKLLRCMIRTFCLWQDAFGDTALHRAAAFGHVDVLGS